MFMWSSGSSLVRTFGVGLRSMKSLRRDVDGAVAMTFGLVLLGVAVAAGLGIDFSRAKNVQTALQQSLDAAVLAAANLDATADEQKEAGKKFFNANFASGIAENVSVDITATGNKVVTGTATATVPATLTALMGYKTLPVEAYASTGLLAYGDVCVLVLDETAKNTFSVTGKTDVVAPDCEIHVKSTANPAAKFSNGSYVESSRICIESTKISDNGGTHDNLELGCDTADDPYAGAFTEPASATCDYNAKSYKGGTVNLKPGVYCGLFNFNSSPKVNFAPGTYVIKNGGWNVSGGTWDGEGVTFFFADDSNIEFNSGVSLDLSPPTSGDYTGILMFEAAGLGKSNFSWNDTYGSGSTVSGLIYLPSRNLTLNAKSGIDGHQLTLVVNQLSLNELDVDLSPADEKITVVTKSPTATDGEVYIAE